MTMMVRMMKPGGLFSLNVHKTPEDRRSVPILDPLEVCKTIALSFPLSQIETSREKLELSSLFRSG